MATRSKTTTPGASRATEQYQPSYAFTELAGDTDECFSSIEAMLIVLSGSLDRDPDRLMPEDMKAMGWQVHLINTFLGELKSKVRVLGEIC